MTTLELRDWHARQQGWRPVADDGNLQRTCWINELFNGCPRTGRTIITSNDGEDIHPIPATIDAAKACFPKGWTWERTHNPETETMDWWAWNDSVDEMPQVPDSGDKVRDLFALARLCLIAQGATP